MVSAHEMATSMPGATEAERPPRPEASGGGGGGGGGGGVALSGAERKNGGDGPWKFGSCNISS